MPRSPIRGVTVSTTPASRYSTDCVPTTAVVVVPVATAPPIGTCWLVTIGIEVETLITAFLFSDVMMDGLESTLSRSSEANVLIAEKNWSVAKVKTLSPARVVIAAVEPAVAAVGILYDGRPWSVPAGFEPRPGALDTSNLPERTAHSIPSRISPVNVTSATRTSIRTWRGLRSSCFSVCSKSVQ